MTSATREGINMDQTPQQQNAEFLRRTINHLTFAEVERYAWLAGAKSLQSMAIRAQEEIEEQLDDIRSDALSDGREEGKDSAREEITADIKTKLDALGKQVKAIATDMERHAQVIAEKAGEIDNQMNLLEGVMS